MMIDMIQIHPVFSAYSDSNAPHDNQDSYLIVKEYGCAVADGVTGGEKGKEASTIAVNLLKEYDPDLHADMHTQFNTLFRKADLEVKKIATCGHYSASTLVAGIFKDGKLYYASVGDSSIILKKAGKISVITESDRVGYAGLLHAIGIGFYTINFKEIAIYPGDTLVFSTDGLTDNLSLPEIGEIIKKSYTNDCARILVDTAISKRKKVDDVTVVIAKIL